MSVGKVWSKVLFPHFPQGKSSVFLGKTLFLLLHLIFEIMNIEKFREVCLALPYATEDMPFDDTVVVFRIKGKIFGAIILDRTELVVLKCDAEYAIELREQFSEIEGAYHWNKKYWNQISLNGSVPDDLIISLCRHAFDEVNKKLPKKDRIVFNDNLFS